MSTLLVTPTSGRPKAFAALTKWVEQQTTENFEWLVVTDDHDGYKLPKKLEEIKVHVIKRDSSNDTLPSICHNWLEALDFIEKHEDIDKILSFEDDDYYCPSYVKETCKLLDKADLAGWEEDCYYYVVNRRARKWHNVGYATLAATAFTREVIPWFRKVASAGDIWIDNLLWRGLKQVTLMPQPAMTDAAGAIIQPPPAPITTIVEEWRGSRILCDNMTGIGAHERRLPEIDKNGNVKNAYCRHVGIKENWHNGKNGLSTVGHDWTLGGKPDLWGDTLRQWIGEKDANFYLDMFEDKYPNKDPNVMIAKNKRYPAGMMIPLPTAV